MSAWKPSITASVIRRAATPSAMPPMAMEVVMTRNTPKRCPTRKRLAMKSWKRIGRLCLWFKQRKQDHFADRCLAEEQHRQPVDADPEAARGRHAVLECRQKCFIRHFGFVVAFFL